MIVDTTTALCFAGLVFCTVLIGVSIYAVYANMQRSALPGAQDTVGHAWHRRPSFNPRPAVTSGETWDTFHR